MNHLMYWVILGLIILNLFGFLMDVTWIIEQGETGYFSYKIALLNNFPYWLFSSIAYITINGIASLCFSDIRFKVSSSEGHYRGGIPLPPIKLFGINLITIPALIVLFLTVRSLNF